MVFGTARVIKPCGPPRGGRARAVLGPDRPDALTSRDILASAYHSAIGRAGSAPLRGAGFRVM
ncbi:hypothetical protein [Microbispora sp. H10885]|uniref:hypothetical protein n=1 Tax=Microbispora sp. H10885 TaxID=2729110 RepID=UPI00160246D3|nr:hypothetical protein [Microbispora sp. H10885]